MNQAYQDAPKICGLYSFLRCRKGNMGKLTLVLFLLLFEVAYRRIEIVAANGNKIIDKGPFLHLEKPAFKRLTITAPHLPHYLSCIATIEESFYYQNETEYYYTWFRNDNELESVWSRRSGFFAFQNGTLRLPKTEKASGVYRCKINANQTAVVSEKITVIFPVLKRAVASTRIKAKNNLPITLNCSILSIPPANVSWYFENQIISKVKKDNSYLELKNGSLILRQVSLSDEGEYKCFAQNQFAFKNTRQFSVIVKVENYNNKTTQQEQQNTKNSRLIPNLQSAVQFIPKGTNLTLYCCGVNESINIEWWFQHSKTDELAKISNHSSESFNIYNADIESDQGIYTCKSLDDHQSFEIIVTTPPEILFPLPSYETLISASLAFSCNSDGNPPPKITWYHNGAYLNSSYSRYINGNELLLHSFDPGEDGIYQCFAENIAGDAAVAAEVRFRNKGEEVPRKNPLKNIRCFPHSFNTINITFESDTTESLFIVHIVQENPHRWTSPFAPMKLNQTSHVVISSQLPIYRPFQLITRVLFPTTQTGLNNKPQQQTILSSLRSNPVTCCTQGLLLHLVQLGLNSTFLTWSQPELIGKKFFILQFSINYTEPHPKKLIENVLLGTSQHVQLNSKDIEKNLHPIEPLSKEISLEILALVDSKSSTEKGALNAGDDEDWHVFNVVLPSNVSGVVLQNFKRIKTRVLIITTENENLTQDFRYVQWKMIQNGTAELVNTPFHLSTIESRMLGIYFQDVFNESCIEICLWKIQFPFFNKEQPKCDQKHIVKSYATVSGLKPMERYRLNFFSCETHAFYGQLDVKTLPDPPGTISNQKIIRNGGLKLIWDSPTQPNGKIHHYMIMWTLGNITYEANVLECNPCSYKFPNLSESSKVNISIRVVGETGVGAPIFIDLRNINHQSLEIEISSANTIYGGILIGILLSVFCILCFVTFIVVQKWRYKPTTQHNFQSEINLSNLSNISLHRTPIQHENTLQHDGFEMQTLIPKQTKTETLKNPPNISQKMQWQLPTENNVQNYETNSQKQQDRNESNLNLEQTNWSNENHLNKRNTSHVIEQGENDTDTVFPSSVYATFPHLDDNEIVRSNSSSVLRSTSDNGNKILLSNRLNQNKTNRMSSVAIIKRSHYNNNNVSPLLQNSHRNGNGRIRRKPDSGKISKEKRGQMNENSLFNLLSTSGGTTASAAKGDASIWGNTLRMQARRPNLGPNG